MSAITIVPFDSQFDRSTFQCTSESLNRYLQQQVSQDIKRRIAACFLAIQNEQIVGYYTLAAHSVPIQDLPSDKSKKLPRYPTVPTVLMGRLAVDERFQGLGIGSVLLVDALKRAAHSEIAAYALVVDAKDEMARSFYQHFGFLHFPEYELKLFYPLSQIS